VHDTPPGAWRHEEKALGCVAGHPAWPKPELLVAEVPVAPPPVPVATVPVPPVPVAPVPVAPLLPPVPLMPATPPPTPASLAPVVMGFVMMLPHAPAPNETSAKMVTDIEKRALLGFMHPSGRDSPSWLRAP
jgi:hypothetical protein